MKRICNSYVPMYLGVLGSIIGVPSSILSGSISLDYLSLEASNVYMYCAFVGSMFGMLFSLLSKRCPYISGTALIICSILSGLTLFIGNALALTVSLLYLFAGFFCFVFVEDI